MQYSFEKSFEILQRTPLVIRHLLSGLSDEWVCLNEGENSWSPYDIVGHLIHGERTDWMQRLNIILNDCGDKQFAVYDRFAQFEESKGKTLNQLIDEFETLRNSNLTQLKALHLEERHLDLKGIHPSFGEITLKQLLSTWTTHDLGHIGQIVRVMAKQYKEEVGPWYAYLRILQS